METFIYYGMLINGVPSARTSSWKKIAIPVGILLRKHVNQLRMFFASNSLRSSGAGVLNGIGSCKVGPVTSYSTGV